MPIEESNLPLNSAKIEKVEKVEKVEQPERQENLGDTGNSDKPNYNVVEMGKNPLLDNALENPPLNLNVEEKAEKNSLYLKKNADFHFLFKTIPINELLHKDYGCALQRDILIHGRIYITENYICFYSNIFGWVTKLIINLEEVIHIEKKNTALIIPNAIEISTLHTKRFFTSFIHRESVYDNLIELWKKSRNRAISEQNSANLYYNSSISGGNDALSASTKANAEFFRSISSHRKTKPPSNNSVSESSQFSPSLSQSERSLRSSPQSRRMSIEEFTGPDDKKPTILSPINVRRYVMGVNTLDNFTNELLQSKNVQSSQTMDTPDNSSSCEFNNDNGDNNPTTTSSTSNKNLSPLNALKQSLKYTPVIKLKSPTVSANSSKIDATANSSLGLEFNPSLSENSDKSLKGKTNSISYSDKPDVMADTSDLRSGSNFKTHNRGQSLQFTKSFESAPSPKKTPDSDNTSPVSSPIMPTSNSANFISLNSSKPPDNSATNVVPDSAVEPASAKPAPVASTPASSSSNTQDSSKPAENKAVEPEKIMKPTTCPCENPPLGASFKPHTGEILFETTFPIPLPLAARIIFHGLPISPETFEKYHIDPTQLNFDEIDQFSTNHFNQIGVKNLKMGKWNPQSLTDSTIPLEINYDRPLNFPIGPKQTNTTESIYVLYCDFDKALVIENVVRTPDVPSGNSFVVKVRTCLSWTGGKNIPGGMTKMTVTCEVEWSKSSWIKKQISAGSKDSVRSDWKEVSASLNKWIDKHPQFKIEPPEVPISVQKPTHKVSRPPIVGLKLDDVVPENNNLEPIEEVQENFEKEHKYRINLSFVNQLRDPMIRWLAAEYSVIPASVVFLGGVLLFTTFFSLIRPHLLSILILSLQMIIHISKKSSGYMRKFFFNSFFHSSNLETNPLKLVLNFILYKIAQIIALLLTFLKSVLSVFGLEFNVVIDGQQLARDQVSKLASQALSNPSANIASEIHLLRLQVSNLTESLTNISLLVAKLLENQ
ncbi:hypothetical protein BB560_002595 [Smittium megazygosporum]|uniref:VASt domain-containing protein n=1 Tax=Smittium megazygosporum TaxID=133381 RepID=A0A2T9ZEG0_9FUNG|nr:hypothetical protein BB560_002595 [Smittium megazygosporum]